MCPRLSHSFLISPSPRLALCLSIHLPLPWQWLSFSLSIDPLSSLPLVHPALPFLFSFASFKLGVFVRCSDLHWVPSAHSPFCELGRVEFSLHIANWWKLAPFGHGTTLTVLLPLLCPRSQNARGKPKVSWGHGSRRKAESASSFSCHSISRPKPRSPAKNSAFLLRSLREGRAVRETLTPRPTKANSLAPRRRVVLALSMSERKDRCCSESGRIE